MTQYVIKLFVKNKYLIHIAIKNNMRDMAVSTPLITPPIPCRVSPLFIVIAGFK